MSRSKYLCLNCRQTNSCKCGTTEFQFSFSHKLRPPTKKQSKRVWRQFLIDCPPFVNLVPVELFPQFNSFLKDLNWKGDHINGFKTPLVSTKESPFFKEHLFR